jgi:hypothetical protein
MEKEIFKFIENEYLFNSLLEKEQQAELVKLGIYVLSKEPQIFPFITKSHTFKHIDVPQKFIIGYEFEMAGKLYVIDQTVIYTLYHKLLWRAMGLAGQIADEFSKQIDHLVLLISNNQEALLLIKKKKKSYLEEYSTLMSKNNEFIDSLKNPREYGYESRKEFLISEIEQDESLIKIYVLNQKIEESSMFKILAKTFSLESSIEECNTKIEELSIPDNYSIAKPSNHSHSTLIFREDGEEIFNALISLTVKEKNTAFFSYLYLFLRKKEKTFSPKYQNKKYRVFVVNQKLIDSFASIQKTDDDNPKSEKNNCFEIFEEDLKKYYSQKSE